MRLQICARAFSCRQEIVEASTRRVNRKSLNRAEPLGAALTPARAATIVKGEIFWKELSRIRENSGDRRGRTRARAGVETPREPAREQTLVRPRKWRDRR